MVHFYGAHVTEAKAVTVTVPEGFVLNVVHAALASGEDAVLSVETTSLDQSLVKVVLGTLRVQKCDQIKLDLVLGAHKAKFSVKGHGAVHLSGYFQPGPPEESSEDDDISRLSVDDLSALIQQAASRISKHNADELEGSDDDNDATPTTSAPSKATKALPTHPAASKKRPRPDSVPTPSTAQASKPAVDQDSDDDDDEDVSPTTPSAPKNLVAPLHKSADGNAVHKKKNKKKKRKNKHGGPDSPHQLNNSCYDLLSP